MRNETVISAKNDENGEGDAAAGFTRRLLSSTVIDIMELKENVERIQVMVFTLARANGLPVPGKE